MLVPVTMHPVTGTFADARVESAFAAMLFRLAFPMHCLLTAIQLALWTWNAFAIPSYSLSYFVTFQLTQGLALAGRVLVHMVHDKVRAQRMGSWTWTALMVAGCSGDMMQQSETGPEDCLQTSWFVPLASLAIALTNGSHGLGFATKFSVISFFLVDDVATMIRCDEGFASLSMRSAIGVAVLGSVCAHLAELQLRRSYAEKVQESHHLAEERSQVDEDKRQLVERMEQLQAEKERMVYDMQHRGHPLDDDNRSAIRRGLQPNPATDSGRSEPELMEAATAAEVEEQSRRSSSQPAHSAISVHAPSESLPASLPAGPPSSTTSASTAPSIPEADRQHYAEIAAKRAARLMAEQKAPHLRWVETGRQWIAKKVGVTRGRVAPTRLASGESLGLERVERVELAELTELAEVADEEIMSRLVVRHLMPAQGITKKATIARRPLAPVAQQSITSHMSAASSSPASHAAPPPAVPSPAASSPAAVPCSSIFLQQFLPAIPAYGTPPSALQNNMFYPPAAGGSILPLFYPPAAAAASAQDPPRPCYAPAPPQPQPQPRSLPLHKVPPPIQDMFATLVMCDYTPRRPSELPTSRWVSYQRLFHLFQPQLDARVAMHVWLMGPGSLKQLIIGWHKTHPAFAGVEVSAWCKRLPQDNSVVYKFCFEYTPKCQVSIPFGL